jgi:AraC family transcriptional regulator
MTTPAEAYFGRFRRVLEYIDTRADADADLSVEALCRVAAFSKFHFHRQFSELFGVAAHKYVQLVRLRRASYRLAFRGDSILDIALSSGYESHEAFSRAFRKLLEQAPSEFRAEPDWQRFHQTQAPLTEVRSEHMSPAYRHEDVSIQDFPETRVAVLEHRGDPRRLGDSIRKFIEWRKQNRLLPRVSATFNLFYEPPEATEDFRLDLCAAITDVVAPNSSGVVQKSIPAGRCAVLRHVGSDDTLAASIHYLYSTWLPKSGEEPRDFPLFARRVRFFPDVPEHEALTEIYLPIR